MSWDNSLSSHGNPTPSQHTGIHRDIRHQTVKDPLSGGIDAAFLAFFNAIEV
jgi:hypothetical protein